MQTYRAVQASAAGKLELVTRPLTEPPPGNVRIRVEACGVCRSDVLTVEGVGPGLTFPRVPGHEVVGRIFCARDIAWAPLSTASFTKMFLT
jgi:alcohol dehydrogenase, propanol-preferring